MTLASRAVPSPEHRANQTPRSTRSTPWRAGRAVTRLACPATAYTSSVREDPLAQRQRQRGSSPHPCARPPQGQRGHRPRPGAGRARARVGRAAWPARRRASGCASRWSRCWCASTATTYAPSTELTDSQKADELKRLDGIATILAKTATRDPSLFGLLSEDSVVTDTARDLRLEMLRKAGVEVAVEEPKPDDEAGPGLVERRVIPQSVLQHQLANPFLRPRLRDRPPSAAAAHSDSPRGSCSDRCSVPSSSAGPRPAWSCPRPCR